MVKIDVRGLSCPEPVLLTLDALDDYNNEEIVVLGDEAHTRKNIEVTLNQYNIKYTVTNLEKEFEIKFNVWKN